jgi:hypothetical protein
MVLLLLIDAFRPDYLAKTDFLRYLGASGAAGRLREPFGFCPRGAYFAGLTPGEVGYAFVFWRDPEESAFRAARLLPDEKRLSPRGREAVRGIAAEQGRAAATPFGSTYIHPQQIPLALLPEIDIAEKYPPWDRRVGYRTLFHEMDDAGMKWFSAAWPYTHVPQPRSDGEIVTWVLDNAGKEHDFVHVQFCELDGIGHQYGPGSREIVECLERTDRLARLLVEGLSRLGRPLDAVIFGDHGMVSVVREIDFHHRLASLRAQCPRDYFYFLDSTVARFWYNHAAARDEIREMLGSLSGGRRLDAEDWQAHGLVGLDERCGEDFFLLDPGCVIAPCFFHAGAKGPAGMHGYHPDASDNQGIFLAAGPHFSPGTDAGVVDATALYPLCRGLLFGSGAQVSFAAGGEAEDGGARERVVSRDLKAIMRRIGELDPGPGKTVVLTGSFGRGEGPVILEDGGGRALNDYDVCVFSHTRPEAARVEACKRELCAELRIPFVDISWLDPRWPESAEQSQLLYDFRYGSKVMAGDYGFLDRLPHRAENDIASKEALQLLCNRAAGILMGLTPAVLGGAAPDSRETQFLWIQVMKAGIAVADHHLFNWGAYSVSYRTRRERLAVLGASAGIDPGALAAIDTCFEFRLRPGDFLERDPRPVWMDIQPAHRAALRARFTEANAGGDEADGGGGFRRAASEYFRRHLRAGAVGPESARALAALLLDTLDGGLRPVAGRLEECSHLLVEAGLPRGDEAPAENAFEFYRSEVVAAWEEQCH